MVKVYRVLFKAEGLQDIVCLIQQSPETFVVEGPSGDVTTWPRKGHSPAFHLGDVLEPLIQDLRKRGYKLDDLTVNE